MIDLKGRVALITGGNRGIGFATAMLFAKAGATVAITYSHDQRSSTLAHRSLEEYEGGVSVLKLKIQDMKSCRSAVREVIRRYGRIDILVNNAGIWEESAIADMTFKAWKRTIDINLTGTFSMCKAVLPTMHRQKFGRIVNISSTVGQRGEAFHSHYAATKGAIISFTKSIAVELIRSGIRVNCVAPGWVDTKMTARAISNTNIRRKIERSIPRGKVATAEEIAGPILFLCSPLADHIVGEVLNVNGGSVLCG